MNGGQEGLTSIGESKVRLGAARLYMSDRYGGVSDSPYDSLNIAFHVGDDEESVKKNRARLLERAKMENKRLFWLNQVHGDEIIEVDRNTPQMVFEGDGLMSDDPSVVLMCMVADCNPIALYDARHRAIALLHAGRAGVRLGILTKAAHQMAQRYDTRMSDLRVYIGASIRGCCYEVSEGIAKDFCAIPRLAVGVRESPKEGASAYYLDLFACLKAELELLGVSDGRIFVNPHCSACNARYFSYRREGRTGRMALLASLEI